MIRVVESDTLKLVEAYAAEDVGMYLAGTAVSDGEFHEEPQLEEPKSPRGRTSSGKVGSHAHLKESGASR